MANSSVCPSPRTVPAHAGAAHAASGVSPLPGRPWHTEPAVTPAQGSPGQPRVLCQPVPPAGPGPGTRGDKHAGCSARGGGRGSVPQELQDQSSAGASGLAMGKATCHRGEDGFEGSWSISVSHT